MEISEKLREARQKTGMTQDQIAEKIMVSRVTVSNWENGYSEPEEELLPEIAGFFGVRIRDLIGDAA